MDDDIPQLFESLREKLGTAERAGQLIDLLEEAFQIGRPISLAAVHCSKCSQYIGNGPGDLHVCGDDAKYEWDVTITATGNFLINVIKLLRDRDPHLQLKDAVYGLRNPPWRIRQRVSRTEAKELRQELEALGATVTVT
jgi:ribosomal protein L7/L12